MYQPRALARLVRFSSLVAVFAAIPLLVHAQFRAEGVVYSFMQMRVGSVEQYLLVPMTTESFRPDSPLQATIPAAFGLLRNGKPAIYGNSSISISDADLAQLRVVVNVDPSMVANVEIIAAETVLTFAQLGIQSVVFSGYAEQGLTPNDIQYGFWRLQVPLWQAVLGGSLFNTDIRLASGELLTAHDFQARLAATDAELDQQILSILSAGNRTATYNVLGVLPALAIPEYEAAVVPLLSGDDSVLRGAALAALAPSQNTAALDAVVALQQNDPDLALRQVASQILAASAVERYRVFELFYRGRNLDSAGRIAAIGSMVSVVDERVNPELVALTEDPESAVAQAAVDTLGARQAWSELLAVMQNDERALDLRSASASLVGSGADGESRLQALQFRIIHSGGEPALLALASIAALSDVSPWGVVEGVAAEHPELAVRVAAAGHVGTAGTSASLSALSEVSRNTATPPELGRALRDAAFGIMTRLPFAEVERFAEGSDAILKASAYRALGALAQQGQGDPSVYALLTGALADSSPEIRGAAARAVSLWRNEEALAAIMPLTADGDSYVLGQVALAFGSFPADVYAERVNALLIGFMESGDAEVVAGAVEALGMLGQVQLRTVILDKIRFPDTRVRAAAMRAAVMLGTEGETRDVVNALAGQLRDEDPANRVLAAGLLGGFASEMSVLALSNVVNDPMPEMRFAAIDALGRTGNASAASVLVSLLDDPAREVRLAALEGLTRLSSPVVIPDLQAAAARSLDPVTVQAINDLLSAIP